MQSYNEQEGVPALAAFRDEYSQPINPSNAYYTLWDDATNKLLTGPVGLTVSTVVGDDGVTRYQAAWTVPGSLNTIQNSRNKQEVKRLLVIANYGLDTEWSEEVTYLVINLKGR